MIFPSVAATATVAVVSAPSGRFALPCQLLADENHTAAEAADGKHDESNDTGPNCHGCFANSVISVWIDLKETVQWIPCKIANSYLIRTLSTVILIEKKQLLGFHFYVNNILPLLRCTFETKPSSRSKTAP